MEKEIENLQLSFKKIIEILEARKGIIQADLVELDDFVDEMSIQQPESKKHFERFKDTIIAYKNDSSKFPREVDRIKDLLSTFQKTLNNINTTNENKSIDNRFGSKKGQPNSDFLKLIQQNLISSEQDIFTQKDSAVVAGNITEDGYFKLKNHSPMFSSLTTALCFVHGKTMTNGWEHWSVLDKNGVVHPLRYYKEQL